MDLKDKEAIILDAGDAALVIHEDDSIEGFIPEPDEFGHATYNTMLIAVFMRLAADEDKLEELINEYFPEDDDFFLN